MTVPFNEIPNNLRVPFAYVEFDGSRAQQGLAQQTYQTLIIGEKTTDGTAEAGEIVRATNPAQASSLFGPGSVISDMAARYFENNSFTETFFLPLGDAVGSVAATGSIEFTGPATASGSLTFYIAGLRFQVGVSVGDTDAEIATAVAAAITAKTSCVVTAAATGSVVDLTAKNTGVVGNDIDVRLNYFEGEATPAGLVVAITAFAGGTGTPDAAALIAAIPEEQYNIIISPYTDAATLTALEAELDARSGPLQQIESYAIASSNGDFSALSALGDGRNSKYFSIMENAGSPTPPWQNAAAIGAQLAFHGAIDPARPFQTLELKGILAPRAADRFTLQERNLLLYNGISTRIINSDGTVRIERVISTYQENEFGASDTSFLDANTALTLSYLRYSLRNRWLVRFPRHKVANDGTRFGSGQPVVTPVTAKAELVALFTEWEERGLVEGVDQFKNDLIVERNGLDPNRLDACLNPDLVNQLRVSAFKIGFLL